MLRLRGTCARHGAYDRRICLSITPQRPKPQSKRLDQLKPCVTPSKSYRSAGILTCCPSTTPFGLVLGPTNPGTIRVALETLSLRWAGFSPAFLLLMPTFSLPSAPRWVTPSASALLGMLLYRSHRQNGALIMMISPLFCRCGSRDFGAMLSPDTFSVLSSLTRELSRFL